MELTNSCKAVFGGVGWPGKRPGFAVIEMRNYFASNISAGRVSVAEHRRAWNSPKMRGRKFHVLS